MIKISAILALTLSLAFGDELPNDVKRLKSQRDQAVEKIDAKFVSQLELLKKKHMKRGDLQSANYVNDILTDLEAKEKIKGTPKNDKELTVFLRDTAWKFSDGKVITFMRNGKMKKNFGVLEPKWIVEDMSIVSEGKIFTFNRDFSAILESTKKAYKGDGIRVGK